MGFNEDVDRERLDNGPVVGPEISEMSILELIPVLVEVEVPGDVRSDDNLHEVEDESREGTIRW